MQSTEKDRILTTDPDERGLLQDEKDVQGTPIEIENFEATLVDMGFKVTKAKAVGDSFEFYILTGVNF